MNLPNLLTLLRIFFVPLLVAALVQESMDFSVGATHISHDLLALGIFLVASTTDLLDGYLARRWKQVTTVGTLLDPIADKLLISAALIALVQVRVVAAWIVVLIVGREFAVTRTQEHRRRGGLHHQGQRAGKDQDGLAGDRHIAIPAEHALEGAGAVGDGLDVAAWWRSP